jgi:hypothetical protein
MIRRHALEYVVRGSLARDDWTLLIYFPRAAEEGFCRFPDRSHLS